MIAEVIRVLKSNTYYNVGEYTEIAKGKNEMIITWNDFKRKIVRSSKYKRNG